MAKINHNIRLHLLACVILLVSAMWALSTHASTQTVRIAVLKYGTVNWELDVIRHHGLDKKHGIALKVIELANTQAAKVALQSGSADIIVTDWLWVSRQRSNGFDFTLVPYSSATGAVIIPDGIRYSKISELKGKKIGVAGGPLDKSWLFLNAFSKKRFGFDLKAETEQVYGAPPLINQLMIKGDVDAILTYWHYTARLEARGFIRMMEVSDVQQDLTGLDNPAAVIGYTFREKWANGNRGVVDGFLRAAEEAREILGSSDEEWGRIAPLMRAESDTAEFYLRQRYRDGIPRLDAQDQVRASQKLYDVLHKIGGETLVGRGRKLAPGTFWLGE